MPQEMKTIPSSVTPARKQLDSREEMVLGWFILCVNLAEIKNARRAGVTLFPGVPVRVFPKEISI